MAWQSGGTTNDELVDNLKRFEVITSDAVEAAFRDVDRRFFVPQNLAERFAHADQPLKQGDVHISAPHIYGPIVEALEMENCPSLSFLNVGSGTGYLSCIVARLLDRSGSCYGVELSREAYEHGLASVERWKAAMAVYDDDDDDNDDKVVLPHMNFVHGNGLCIDVQTGEGRVGFDRIYVGAAIDQSDLADLQSLLRVGGILVAPVGHLLKKICRTQTEFEEEILTSVSFAPLKQFPLLEPTVLPSRVWNPKLHAHYPRSFQTSCREILLCSMASSEQPVPKTVTNDAATIPGTLWLEILSYTHRDWFEPTPNRVTVLEQQLQTVRKATERANKARQKAETRASQLERERDAYRFMVERLRARLRRALDGEGEGDEGEQEVIRLGSAEDQDDDDSDDDSYHESEDMEEDDDDDESVSDDELEDVMTEFHDAEETLPLVANQTT